MTLMPPLLQSDRYDEINFEATAARQQYEVISEALDQFRKCWNSEYLTALREKHNNRCADKPTHHLKPGSLVMVQRDDRHRTEWPLGKITQIFPGSNGVIRAVEVEEGGERSTCSLTFIVPLQLDCKEAAIIQAEERNTETEEEEGNIEQLPQSPVPRDTENGVEENKSAGPQPELEEAS